MRGNVFTTLAAVAVAAAFSVAPVNAGGLLGGLKDTVSGAVNTVADTVGNVVSGPSGGGTSVGGLVSLNDNDNGSLVNLDVGGGSNVLNAGVGAGSKPVNASVSSTGLLSKTFVGLDLGGLGLDVDLDLGLAEDPGTGGPGAPGNGQVLVGSLGGGNTFVINCTVNNTRQLLQVASAGKVTGPEIKAWMRAANVQVVPIKLCPPAKKQVAALLAKSQKINLLRRAVTGDALITASLGRTRFDANDVIAVQRNGAQLVVYVY